MRGYEAIWSPAVGSAACSAAINQLWDKGFGSQIPVEKTSGALSRLPPEQTKKGMSRSFKDAATSEQVPSLRCMSRSAIDGVSALSQSNASAHESAVQADR